MPLEDVTLDALRCGKLEATDIRASRETLRRQAGAARAADQPLLAEGLERGAELTEVSDEVIIELYTALRPKRSSAVELDAWADRLENELAAPRTAGLVREALEVYRVRGLLAEEGR